METFAIGAGAKVLIAIAIALASTAAAAPALDWSIDLLYGENEIYPSALASVTDACAFPPRLSSQLGDPTGLICARIVAPEDDYPVEVTVAPTTIFGVSSVRVRLPHRGETYRVAPRLALKHATLLGLHHAIPGEWLRVTVAAGGMRESKLRNVRIHAVNDCLMGVWMYQKGSYNRTFDTAFLSAAYVNEYDTLLTRRVLGCALAQGYVEAFDGYDSGSALAVGRQVKAIYDALHALGCRYSSVALASLSETAHQTGAQWIRESDDALRSDQANCLDGTVLFASIAMQIKLRPVIFQIPGEHAFLGVRTAATGEKSSAIIVFDTVYVGTADFAVARRKGEAELAAARSHRREIVLSDQTARALVSLASPAQTQRHFLDFLTRRDANAVFYQTDVRAARAMGIVPLAELGERAD